MPRFLRDPLFVCLLLGLAVFVLDRWLDRGGDRAVYVGASDLARLQAQWAAQGGRPPTPRELQGLVEEHIREEILSREAQALGLDRGDVIIRRRLVQKLRFVTEDIALETAPDPTALEAFFKEHADRYAAPETVTFSHVYFSSDRHDDARALAREALAELSEQNGEAWLEVGDPFLLNRTYADRTLTDVRELFGSVFAEGIAELETGSWSGPVESAYGFHLVRVTRRVEARARSLEEARSEVERDFSAKRKRDASETYYRSLRDRYQVEISPDVLEWLPPQ